MHANKPGQMCKKTVKDVQQQRWARSIQLFCNICHWVHVKCQECALSQRGAELNRLMALGRKVLLSFPETPQLLLPLGGDAPLFVQCEVEMMTMIFFFQCETAFKTQFESLLARQETFNSTDWSLVTCWRTDSNSSCRLSNWKNKIWPLIS